jgi:erythronate-4-phosphate dehydrogenase
MIMKIVVDDKIPFLQGVFEPFAEVVYLQGSKINRTELKNADALIIRTRTICNNELLENTSVKFIATATIGYDHIDTKWCDANGIKWTNAEGCNASSVMQYLASALVFLSKKHGFKFSDRTLGVVGVGNVGRKVVKLGEILGMRIVLNDPPLVRKLGPCGFISLDGIIREADIITLHVPLNLDGEDKTFHLFNESVLKKLNTGTFLINSSRGEVVNNKSLKDMLISNRLHGAVLDVWENEPEIDLELMKKLDIGTPHIAGYSVDGKANGTAMSVRALSKFFNLGIDNWFPGKLPLPSLQIIEIDAKGKTEQEILCQAIESTYKVADDDKRLRNNPKDFEKQRVDYPVRREFQAYTVKVKNGTSEMTEKLKRLGFNVVDVQN